MTLIKFTISHCLKRRQRETNKRKNYSVSHRKRRKEGSEAWFPGLWVGKIHWRRLSTPVFLGFPCDSAGKESACNAGNLDSIPGLGRSPGEGIGYPLQYSWAFLVTQLVKNLPAMRETWIRSLGWEDPLEKGKATQSSILAWRISWTTVHGVAKSRT